MSEHTPTPWKVTRDERGSIVRACDEFDAPVASLWLTKHDPEANAAFIVKAVNNHDALVQFAEFIRDGYERTDINHVDFRVGAYKAALDVLASLVGTGKVT